MISGLKRIVFAATMLAPLFAVGTASAEPHKIDFWYGLSGRNGDVVQKLCTNFNGSQSEFAVECRQFDGYEAAFQAAIAAYRSHTNPVILQADSPYTGTLMLSDAVIPAYQLMADQGIEVKWDDYIAPIKNMYADREGRMWSFPFNTSTDMLWTNMELYQKAGLSKPPTTFEEFESNLRALKKAGVSCPYAFEFQWYVQLTQFSAYNDQPLTTRANGFDGLGAEFVVDKTDFVKLAADLKRWRDEGLLVVYGGGAAGNGYDAFIRGECAHLMRSISGHADIRANAPFRWEVSRLPVFEKNAPHNSIAGGASLWTMKGHQPEDYRAAAAFFQFLGALEQQEFWVRNTGYVPVTNGVYEALVAKGFYKDPQFAGREKAVESLNFTPVTENSRGFRLGNFAQVITVWTEEMQNIMSGAKTPEAGVADFVARGNQALARFAEAYPGKALP
jgi:sn-glycerol 3-phosphate transport system substrate-binding protein